MGACTTQASKLKKDQGDSTNQGSPKRTFKMTSPKKETKQGITITQDVLVKINDEDPMKNYVLKKNLGSGAFGQVDLVYHKETGSFRAMKRICKKGSNYSHTTEQEVMNEIEMLKRLDHFNLVKIYEFYSTKDYYYIVTDYCKEGELYDKIQEFGPFDEKQSAYIIYQILSAIHFCHSSNIIHRDLKPENILIDGYKDEIYYDIKIIDFGTAKIFEKNKLEKKRIGSSYYMAPEVLKKNYTEKCDVWSVGVIMYILLCKFPPFNGDTDEKIYEAIKIGEYDLESNPMNMISSNARNLLQKLLEKNPDKRLSAEDALKHDWFIVNKTKEMLFVAAKKDIKAMLNKLYTYKPFFKLQQVAIAFIVHNISKSDEVKKIFQAFQLIDENGDGRITKDELFKSLATYDPLGKNPEEKVEKIFENIDNDNNGYIEFEEFARIIIDKKKILNNDIIRFTFNFFDKDRSGEITVEELMDIFGQDHEAELIELINEIDSDNNGKIDFNEFKEMMFKILG